MTEEGSSYLLVDAERLQRAADILKTVAHPARLAIINFLEAGEQSVIQICEWINAPQPFVSHQLSLMKAKGIVSSRRNGNRVMYSVVNRSVIDVIHCVRKHGQGHEECP